MVKQSEKYVDLPLTDGRSGEDTTISTRDGTLALSEGLHSEGTDSRDTIKLLASVTTNGDRSTLANVLNSKLTTRGSNSLDAVRLGVVRLATTVSKSLNHLWFGMR